MSDHYRMRKKFQVKFWTKGTLQKRSIRLEVCREKVTNLLKCGFVPYINKFSKYVPESRD